MAEARASWVAGSLCFHTSGSSRRTPRCIKTGPSAEEAGEMLQGTWRRAWTPREALAGSPSEERGGAGLTPPFVYLRRFHGIVSLSLTACLQWVSAGGQLPSAVSF